MTNKTTTTKSSNNKSEMSKKYHLTTEIFKDRPNLPSFLTSHRVFKTPHKISKIFPSIGLKNFKEPCELAKPLVDLKKENFISSLITVMLQGLFNAREEATIFADRVQFLLSGKDREAQLGKLDDIYNLAIIVRNLIPQIDTYNNAYEKVIQNSEGKIVLRLTEDVSDRNGKAIFRKNESLFKVFAKLKDQFAAYNLSFLNLEQTNEFKIFCTENVPNKKYTVVFSAEGSEGAWDILTMSMRGIKSCQRWDGDYPRCLIGSIVSKYVGIIYITSGADYEGRGSKMMRRSLVRYAVDADEGKPCLLIDRIYPVQQGQDVEEETLQIFKKALASKTSLPIHFAPTLGTKTRHFYVPFEKMRIEVPERDWTYQDTPLKTNLDFQLYVLSSSYTEEANRYIQSFKFKLTTKLGEQFRQILSNNIKVDPEISKTVQNIRLNQSITTFNDQMINLIVDKSVSRTDQKVQDPKEYYKKYLTQTILSLSKIKKQKYLLLCDQVAQSVSRQVDHKLFIDFLFNEIKSTALEELKASLN